MHRITDVLGHAARKCRRSLERRQRLGRKPQLPIGPAFVLPRNEVLTGRSERCLDGDVEIQRRRIESFFVILEIVEIDAHDFRLVQEGPFDLVRGTRFEVDDQVDKVVEIGPVAPARMSLAIDVPARLREAGAYRRLHVIGKFA